MIAKLLARSYLKTLLLALLIALLSACAGPDLHLDPSYSARSQSSRVKFIVLHYTAGDLPHALDILTQQDVSSHYLLSDAPHPVVYALVDESRQANHAGISNWKTYTHLNTSSIGIEIVNPGFTQTLEGRLWHPFAPQQIDQLIVLLKHIVARHGIAPQNILGHSDIAPQRKSDPGPLFPWHRLAAAGLIAWPDAAQVASRRFFHEQRLPELAWFQARLAMHGFAVPQSGELDPATRNVVRAFQMKYRPSQCDGTPDAETAAILDVLTSAPHAAVKLLKN